MFWETRDKTRVIVKAERAVGEWGVAAEIVYFEYSMFKKLNNEVCRRKKHIHKWGMQDEPLLIKLYYMFFYTTEILIQKYVWSLHFTSLKIALGLQYMFQKIYWDSFKSHRL